MRALLLLLALACGIAAAQSHGQDAVMSVSIENSAQGPDRKLLQTSAVVTFRLDTVAVTHLSCDLFHKGPQSPRALHSRGFRQTVEAVFAKQNSALAYTLVNVTSRCQNPNTNRHKKEKRIIVTATYRFPSISGSDVYSLLIVLDTQVYSSQYRTTLAGLACPNEWLPYIITYSAPNYDASCIEATDSTDVASATGLTCAPRAPWNPNIATVLNVS